MKTRLLFIKLSLLLLMATLTFSACKKKQKSFDITQASIDIRNVNTEIDAVVYNVMQSAFQQRSLVSRSSDTLGTSGVMGSGYYPTVDTTNLASGSIQLNYDGTSPDLSNIKRAGSIKITVQNYAEGKKWRQKDCVLKLDYLNYHVIRPSDGESILLNGSQLLTNVSGGTWLESINLKSYIVIVLTVTGTNLSVTFEDGKTASYNINRKYTFCSIYSRQNVINCWVDGIGSLNGLSNLENYGLTREGDEFTSRVVTTVVWKSGCGPGAPVSGEVKIKVDKKEFESKCLFGVDKSGSQWVYNEFYCAYGWKIESKYKNSTNSKVIAYQ